ncbi:hypothetical protein CC85DRAFT_288420 [Cutaneotrichosporon oleaginosum]|uniref:Uncharacterized protein n=1 Tax=Cutaneotrichosporon oleaginosum TaxID=879819 RepID=A0A0J0XET5_9TREE|nr:uncharacterized protein CC85DRAFT_288420 [Cutaneotrichosporon oleaginosum]KLT39563.1 hypothetical protein CC85DRAFT_288420 [Cutaneotrichosporon oleaginosum]TXT08021.1 hypothetical protein COLE_04945 [Cutaneotrichosporon oleaginosum]
MAPTPDELEDLVLSARYGDLEDVQAFADAHGWEAVAAARDDRGNSALHMACGNGHVDVLNLILSNVPASALPALIAAKNEAGSPAVHWAVLNNHVAAVQALVEVPEASGGGIQVLKETNAAKRDAFAEAVFAGEGKEEVAGWIEGYVWKIEGDDDEVRVSAGEVTDDEVPSRDEQAEAVDEVADKAGQLKV